MPELIALTGRQYKTYTVTGRAGRTKNGTTTWRCQCECGHALTLPSHTLRKGLIPQCHCAVRRAEASVEAQAAYDKIINRISTVTGIPSKDLRGHSRDPLHSAARHVIRKVMRTEGFSLPQIAKAMRCNHTTILRSTRMKDPFGRLTTLLQADHTREIQETVSRWRDALIGELQEAKFEEQDDRELFRRAVERLATVPIERRQAVWTASCRVMFPHDFERQGATPPRGVEFAPPVDCSQEAFT